MLSLVVAVAVVVVIVVVVVVVVVVVGGCCVMFSGNSCICACMHACMDVSTIVQWPLCVCMLAIVHDC